MPEQDWITVTEQTVLDRFNPDEQASYNALDGSQDSLTPIVVDLIDEIRGKIKAGGYQRGPDGTIPRSLKGAFVSKAIWNWINGYSNNPKLASDGRKKNFDNAEAELTRIMKGEQPVELPDAGTPADTTSAPRNASTTVREGKHVHKTSGLT